MSGGPRISWQVAREGRGWEDQGGCLEVEPIGQGGPRIGSASVWPCSAFDLMWPQHSRYRSAPGCWLSHSGGLLNLFQTLGSCWCCPLSLLNPLEF